MSYIVVLYSLHDTCHFGHADVQQVSQAQTTEDDPLHTSY